MNKKGVVDCWSLSDLIIYSIISIILLLSIVYIVLCIFGIWNWNLWSL